MDDSIFLAANTPKLVYWNAINRDSLFAWIPVTGEKNKEGIFIVRQKRIRFHGKGGNLVVSRCLKEGFPTLLQQKK
jgi:hypothetical protein